MKDINGKELAVGQTVVIASNSTGSNCPILKKAKVLDIKEPVVVNHRVDGYIKLEYLESGRKVTIDGYLYITDKRFCIID